MLKRLIVRYKAVPSIIKASFFFVLSGVMKDAVDILTTPIFTRLLTTEEYGLFSVYNSYYQIIRIVVSLYMFGEGFSVGMSRFSGDSEAFTSSMQGLVTILFLLWGVVSVVFRQYWVQLTSLSYSLFLIMLVQTLFTTAMNCWQQKKKYVYDYRAVTITVIVYLLLQPLLGIVLIRLNPGQWNNGMLRIYAGVGVQILFGAVLYVLQFIRKPVFYHKSYWSFALKTNLPLLPHALSQILLNHSDRLMIDAFVGKSETAVYAIGHAAAFTLFAFTANINSIFVPWLYERLKLKRVQGNRRLVTALLIITSCMALVLVLIAPEAIAVLGGKKYVDSIWVVPPLVFGVFLSFVYSVFADVELFYGKNHYVMIASAIGMVSNIVLNLVFIPIYGYVAAGYTTVVGFLLMSLIHYYFLRKTCHTNDIRASDMVSGSMLLAITAVLALCCGLAIVLYPYVAIRYAVLLVFIVFVIWKRKKLTDLYRLLRRKNSGDSEK